LASFSKFDLFDLFLPKNRSTVQVKGHQTIRMIPAFNWHLFQNLTFLTLKRSIGQIKGHQKNRRN